VIERHCGERSDEAIQSLRGQHAKVSLFERNSGIGGLRRSDRSKKRGKLRAALDEIADRTRGVQGGIGCIVGKINSGLVGVSRPKELPFLEGQRDMRLSDSAGPPRRIQRENASPQ
jgi:hypothetical protein